MSTIIYTKVDEAPALATYSFLPIVQTFLQDTGISIETRDISLSGRLISNFTDYLEPHQHLPNDLAALGNLVKTKDAIIIKLPNISASVSQLKAAITELQAKGYAIPDFPENPKTDNEKTLLQRFSKVLGSAVNPVLREGNSDRRVPLSVKNYAKKNPHTMGDWSSTSKTHVSTMTSGDFFANEKSLTLDKDTTLTIEHVAEDGAITCLKEAFSVNAGDIMDTTFLSVRKLEFFIEAQLTAAKKAGILFSLHLKATMMKVSDPIIFGHVVRIFFKDVFSKYEAQFSKIGINPNNGLNDLFTKIANLPLDLQTQINDDMAKVFASRPKLAMVNSDKGITNFHVSSDVIIDASMPAMIRDSGKMYDAEGMRNDTNAVIPDSTYARIYEAVIEDCKRDGALNPATMGSVSNVGLMAQKAEEYGSHDKTFEIPVSGHVRVVDGFGKTIFTHHVESGDIWRMCRVTDAAVQDWVKLAIDRTTISQIPAVFWLDSKRAHDAQLIQKVTHYLKNYDTSKMDIQILSPFEATKHALKRLRAGHDTISVTGNVLRDYNTDLFPILELGTSSKMLSVVPLMHGGGLFETGAGGSAPKHVQQFVKEGHLRWDSLGEFLALGACLEFIAHATANDVSKILATTLDQAIGLVLENKKSPKREVGLLDTRGSHYFLAMYWAQCLAIQTENTVLHDKFKVIFKALVDHKAQILSE